MQLLKECFLLFRSLALDYLKEKINADVSNGDYATGEIKALFKKEESKPPLSLHSYDEYY